jgi:hypothetical protein
VLFDKRSSCLETAVKIESSDHSLERIRKKSWLSATAALFFTAAEQKQRAEIDASSDFTEMPTADERGTKSREFAFARRRKAAKERFGNRQAEHSVAEELELFVIGGGVGEGLGIGFVGEGTMSKSPRQQLGTLKDVAGQRRRRAAVS